MRTRLRFQSHCGFYYTVHRSSAIINFDKEVDSKKRCQIEQIPSAVSVNLSVRVLHTNNFVTLYILPLGTLPEPIERMVVVSDSNRFVQQHSSVDFEGPLGFNFDIAGQEFGLYNRIGHPVDAFAISNTIEHF